MSPRVAMSWLAVAALALIAPILMAAVQSGNPSPGPVGIVSSNVAVCDPYNPMNCVTPAATTTILAGGTTGAVTATMPIVAGQTNIRDRRARVAERRRALQMVQDRAA
jgi:hypothetical protein